MTESHRLPEHQMEEVYLTSREYRQPRFGGAVVAILAPQTQDSVTWDLVQFKVPGGKGFTLRINRKICLLDREEGSITRQFSDYRFVNGVRLPFLEKKPADDGDLDVAFSNRTLRKHLDSAAFAIPFRKDYTMPG